MPPLGYPSFLELHTLVDAVDPQDDGPEEEAHAGPGRKPQLLGQDIPGFPVHQDPWTCIVLLPY